jgi:hypothetical protein
MSYIIENITTKEVITKYGPKPAYSVYANGERFNYGWKKPTFGINDEVDFQYTDSTYGKTVDLTSVRLINKGTPPATASSTTAAPARSGGGGYAAKVFPIPPLHGDRAIVRQNSVTNASKIVADFKGKYESIEAYTEAVISTARMLEAYSCGDIDRALAESMSSEG